MDNEQGQTSTRLRRNVKFVYHFGAPFSENDQLIWSLRKNSVLLSENGVSAPRPKRFKSLIPTLISGQDGNLPPVEDQESFFSAICSKETIDRVILSNSTFIGSPTWMLADGKFYPNAARNIANIRNLLPGNPCEFFIGLSNPVKCMSAAFGAQTNRSHQQFFNKIELESIRWSDVILAIKEALPDTPISVWCDEDTPILWPTIMRDVSGLNLETPMEGEFDIIRKIMSKEGSDRMEAYLNDRPNLNELQRRRVKAEFLQKFVLSSAVEEEIDLKGWTDATVDALTEIYEDDIERIERMPGINLISA